MVANITSVGGTKTKTERSIVKFEMLRTLLTNLPFLGGGGGRITQKWGLAVVYDGEREYSVSKKMIII